MHYPGFLVTLEGIEGCGKTVQAQMLRKAIEKHGYPVTLTKEPGGTALGAKIRKMLLTCQGLDISPEAELLLYAADRAQHVRELMIPLLEAGNIVVCDRFLDATVAYQGGGRGLERRDIDTINRFAAKELQPDLTVVLDLDVERGLTRAQERNLMVESGKREDRFEREEAPFHERVRRGYLSLAKADPERIKVVDAGREAEEVHKEVLSLFMPALIEKGTK